MTLKYDIDIQDVVPSEIYADPKLAAMLNEAGIKQDAPKNKVAMFRHQEAVDALAAAPADVQAVFEAAGFSKLASGRDLPDGFYLAHEEAAQLHFLNEINANLHLLTPRDQPDATNSATFSFADFLKMVVTAKPIPVAHSQPATAPMAASVIAGGTVVAKRKSAFTTIAPFALTAATLWVLITYFGWLLPV